MRALSSLRIVAVFAVLSTVFLAHRIGAQAPVQAPAQPQPVTAIRAGRLIDPETGTASANQIILIQGTRIRQIGANLTIPTGANVIDLSKLTVLPGLVDAH